MVIRCLPPPEWAPHAACWVAWPSDVRLWPQLARVQEAFVRMCRGIARGERLEVLVQREDEVEASRQALEGLDAGFHVVPFGDIWMRDTGPIFLRAPQDQGTDLHNCISTSAAAFRWTGWGGKYPYPGDAEVAAQVAARCQVPLTVSELAMEGGGLEHDGGGLVLTTRECALHPARNPGASEVDVERALSSAVGAERVVWIARGLAHDHTDGHIDNLARFVAPGRVVCARPSGTDDPNRAILEEVESTLRRSIDAEGRALEVVTLPSPGRIEGRTGEVLPASHLNFYIANRTLVVPVYGGREEDRALTALSELFPDREVWPVPCQVLLEEGGAVHCITQQQPVDPGALGSRP